MEAKIKTHKKSLDQNLTPKKSHAKFLSHKNLFVELHSWYILIGTITNLKIVLNTHKNPCLNQATQKILAKIFQPQKIPKFKISHSKKNPSCHLKSGVPPPGMPAENISLMPSSCLSLTTLIHARIAYQEFLWMMASAEMYKGGGL